MYLLYYCLCVDSIYSHSNGTTTNHPKLTRQYTNLTSYGLELDTRAEELDFKVMGIIHSILYINIIDIQLGILIFAACK